MPPLKSKTSKVRQPLGKTFRMEAKNFFLTFPQTDTTREAALTALQEHFSSNLKGASIAQEKHADGDTHLHILVFLHHKLRTRSPTYFDFICMKHGNYQTMRDPQKSLRYCSKEDQQILNYGLVPSIKSPSGESKSNTVAAMIQSGSSLIQVAQALPGYFLLNQEKIRKFQSFCIETKNNELAQSLRVPIPLKDLNAEQEVIVAWLNTNLFSPRKFKQSQLWIYGQANVGKTSLINGLSRYFKVYHIPNGEDFYDFFDNDVYDLAVIDEFRGCDKSITWMNQWLQGSRFTLRKKGAQIMKTQNIPTIVLSNFSPSECYSKVAPAVLSTLLSRLEILYVQNIHFSDYWWDNLGKPRVLVPDTQAATIADPNGKDEAIELSDEEDDRPTEINNNSNLTPLRVNDWSDDDFLEVNSDDEWQNYSQSPII